MYSPSYHSTFRVSSFSMAMSSYRRVSWQGSVADLGLIAICTVATFLCPLLDVGGRILSPLSEV